MEKKNVRSAWRVAAAATLGSVLITVPLLTFAQGSNDRFGQQIVDRIFARLCERGILKGPRCVSPPPAPAKLTLIKTVVNDNGGTATTTSFQARIDGTNVAWGVEVSLSAGTHTASEVNMAGYTASSWGGDCAANGTISLGSGDHKMCTITNDDVPPPAPGHLIVDKVTQPSGSTTEFSIMATGTGAITGGGSGTTTDAVSKHYEVAAGTYSVSETAMDGWMTVSNTCVDVAVAAGETETCTITNLKLPMITVTKMVVNDNTGTATSSDFTIHVHDMSGTTTVDVAGSPQPGSAVGSTYTVAPGPYHVMETGGPAGYTATIGGDCASDGSITLAAGDVKSCTVTNNDEPPQAEGKLLITEVMYYLLTDDSQGFEPRNEWIELHNGMNSDVNLAGYFIHDAISADALPGITIPAGGFAIITGTSTTDTFWSIPNGVIRIVLGDTTIGSGLGNDGDKVWLESPASTTVDAISWGDDTSVFDPVAPDVIAGYSLARTPMTTDTDTAADWTGSAAPTPGS